MPSLIKRAINKNFFDNLRPPTRHFLQVSQTDFNPPPIRHLLQESQGAFNPDSTENESYYLFFQIYDNQQYSI